MPGSRKLVARPSVPYGAPRSMSKLSVCFEMLRDVLGHLWLQFGYLGRPQEFAVPETFDASRHDAYSSYGVMQILLWGTHRRYFRVTRTKMRVRVTQGWGKTGFMTET